VPAVGRGPQGSATAARGSRGRWRRYRSGRSLALLTGAGRGVCRSRPVGACFGRAHLVALLDEPGILTGEQTRRWVEHHPAWHIHLGHDLLHEGDEGAPAALLTQHERILCREVARKSVV